MLSHSLLENSFIVSVCLLGGIPVRREVFFTDI